MGLCGVVDLDSIRVKLTCKEFKEGARLAEIASKAYEENGELFKAAQCQQLVFSCYYRLFGFSAGLSGETQ